MDSAQSGRCMHELLADCITWPLATISQGGVNNSQVFRSDDVRLKMFHSTRYVYGRGMLWHVNRAGPIKQLMDEAGERVERGQLLHCPWVEEGLSFASMLASSVGSTVNGPSAAGI